MISLQRVASDSLKAWIVHRFQSVHHPNTSELKNSAGWQGLGACCVHPQSRASPLESGANMCSVQVQTGAGAIFFSHCSYARLCWTVNAGRICVHVLLVLSSNDLVFMLHSHKIPPSNSNNPVIANLFLSHACLLPGWEELHTMADFTHTLMTSLNSPSLQIHKDSNKLVCRKECKGCQSYCHNSQHACFQEGCQATHVPEYLYWTGVHKAKKSWNSAKFSTSIYLMKWIGKLLNSGLQQSKFILLQKIGEVVHTLICDRIKINTASLLLPRD